jgi:hypothetical protein
MFLRLSRVFCLAGVVTLVPCVARSQASASGDIAAIGKVAAEFSTITGLSAP